MFNVNAETHIQLQIGVGIALFFKSISLIKILLGCAVFGWIMVTHTHIYIYIYIHTAKKKFI